MDKKETSEVKDLESSIGNSTKIPGVDDEDMVKVEKSTTKVVKMKKDSDDELHPFSDEEAFVSPEDQKLLADAKDSDKGTDRKVNFASIEKWKLIELNVRKEKDFEKKPNPKGPR